VTVLERNKKGWESGVKGGFLNIGVGYRVFDVKAGQIGL